MADSRQGFENIEQRDESIMAEKATRTPIVFRDSRNTRPMAMLSKPPNKAGCDNHHQMGHCTPWAEDRDCRSALIR